jgi:ATP-dependent Clp protease ATP-binding subunit ClpA
MFEHFHRDSRTVVRDARDESKRAAAPTLEAQHLLLALSRHATWDAGRLLGEMGLDHDGLRRALQAEEERSLATVGIALAAFDLPDRRTGRREARWSASSKVAMQRALAVAKEHGDRYVRPTHLLLGVLGAREGTVPRALAGAGIDQQDLRRRARATLTTPG